MLRHFSELGKHLRNFSKSTEYVYGATLPAYRFDYSLDGLALNIHLTQSGVDKDFRMAVPLYLDFGEGHVSRRDLFP